MNSLTELWFIAAGFPSPTPSAEIVCWAGEIDGTGGRVMGGGRDEGANLIELGVSLRTSASNLSVMSSPRSCAFSSRLGVNKS